MSVRQAPVSIRAEASRGPKASLDVAWGQAGVMDSKLVAAVARTRSRVVAEVADRLAADLPDVEVRASEAGVTISALGLWRRRIGDARLRGIMALVKGTGR